ncbi:cytochrome c [Ruegeria sediminis]|uniref:Cytochrome c n=1 Tax=Ruegeria sediminis TaxID=2583820 RepID=A0ABY2X2S8_9RHOB|nr:cytochrome c [Ruegeria sediminis]TMV09691.1 cytochrome c [Ruegeria sediminis]
MKKTFSTLALITIFGAGGALAQDYGAELKARQGQMRLLALNLGILGGMAKGDREYDAELAQAAAENFLIVTGLNQVTQWPEGSHTQAIEGSDAKAEVWTNFADFQKKWGDLAAPAAQLQTAAGQGAAEIGAALGPVGGACKACHDDYRVPQN